MPQLLTEAQLSEAVEHLRQGELVAFPTETVYGLGALALNPEAVAKIFAAKGRPSHNPLIVHVREAQAARELVTAWPETATRLVERFWPGPLTLVLPRAAVVPDLVTAGGPTVALRSPAHPLAQQLLAAVQAPLAAPSANRSGQLSPTTAAHVLASQLPGLDLILDGGPCSGGLESTVLDLSRPTPRLLRPGLVTLPELEALIGPITVGAVDAATLPSPGLLNKHYAPRTALECADDADELNFLKNLYETAGLKVGVLTLPADPRTASRELFARLHDLDAAGFDRVLTIWPPEEPAWMAIRDRLRRASADE